MLLGEGLSQISEEELQEGQKGKQRTEAEIAEIKSHAATRAREIVKENGGDIQETFNELLIKSGDQELISVDPNADKRDYLLTPFEKEFTDESALSFQTDYFEDLHLKAPTSEDGDEREEQAA